MLQELIEARKEERKRKRAEGKGRISNAASWDEDEQKVKMEGADSGFGAFENGDGPEHRWVPSMLAPCFAALSMCQVRVNIHRRSCTCLCLNAALTMLSFALG